MDLFTIKRRAQASDKEAAVYLESARETSKNNREVAETLKGLVLELLAEQEEKKQKRLQELRDRKKQ